MLKLVKDYPRASSLLDFGRFPDNSLDATGQRMSSIMKIGAIECNYKPFYTKALSHQQSLLSRRWDLNPTLDSNAGVSIMLDCDIISSLTYGSFVLALF